MQIEIGKNTNIHSIPLSEYKTIFESWDFILLLIRFFSALHMESGQYMFVELMNKEVS